MEVGAVAAADIASVDRIAAAPSTAALVITHHRSDVFIEDSRGLDRGVAGIVEVRADCSDTPGRRHQRIGAEILRKSPIKRLRRSRGKLAEIDRLLFPRNLELYFHGDNPGKRGCPFREKDPVSVVILIHD